MQYTAMKIFADFERQLKELRDLIYAERKMTEIDNERLMKRILEIERRYKEERNGKL